MTSAHVPVQLRWGDVDAYGHVNNVSVLRVLEEARARAFWTNGPLPPLRADEPSWALVSAVTVRYHRPVEYQEHPVLVELWTTRVGGASFEIGYAVRVREVDEPAVTAESTVVTIDASTGRPIRLPALTKERLRSFDRSPRQGPAGRATARPSGG